MRVWSWLRTNAGGMPNTCKSNGTFTFELFGAIKFTESGERVSNAWTTCLAEGDSLWKLRVIPHKLELGIENKRKRFSAARGVRVSLASWWGNGSPGRRWLAGLRGRTATLELRDGPDSYGRQQWGILRNGGNSDAAMPRGWWQTSVRKALFWRKREDGTSEASPGQLRASSRGNT